MNEGGGVSVGTTESVRTYLGKKAPQNRFEGGLGIIQVSLTGGTNLLEWLTSNFFLQ